MTLPTNQIQELLDLTKQLEKREDQGKRSEGLELSEELYEELEHSLPLDRKSEAANKLLVPELRKHNMDAAQTVATIYKGAERLRTTARSATRIDGDLKCIIEEGGQEGQGQIMKKVRRLTIYGMCYKEKIGLGC
ncbi:hypothetical protein G6F37_006364 [Rhizopus arrhizus]|nr:hypothetical protein G6F38_006987 [Rhizopus arrhizus]KAG1157813.1 hypothetical protein G6F37_006364 [Rhizopus arrhizus]